jgi:hypothetical protein
MSSTGQQPSEEELRAYETEVKRIRVEHVLLEHVVTLVNLGMRRTGLVPGTEDERDPAQVRLAIEAIRNVLPLLEQSAPQQIGPIRDALSQLQMAFVQIGGTAGGEGEPDRPEAPSPGAAEPAEAGPGGSGAGGEPGPEQPEPGGGASQPPPPDPGAPGPAQSSGRLWVPDR